MNNDIKKTAPDVAASRAAEDGYKLVSSFISDKTISYSPPEGKFSSKISPFLLKGEENALSSRELISLTGVSSPRILRALIAKERENCVPILSKTRNGGGYYLPDDGIKGHREVEAFLQSLYAMAFSLIKTLRPFEYYENDIDGQITIEETESGEK